MCDAGCCWRPRATACPSRPNTAAAETLSDGAQAAPGAAESPVIHHSTTTERLGNMLAMCLSRGHPTASTCTTPPHSLGSMEVRHHRLGGLASGGASERGGGSSGSRRRDQRWWRPPSAASQHLSCCPGGLGFGGHRPSTLRWDCLRVRGRTSDVPARLRTRLGRGATERTAHKPIAS